MTAIPDPLLRQTIRLRGHFSAPVTVEGARPLGDGYELQVRRHDGMLDETIISADEPQALLEGLVGQPASVMPVDGHQLRLLVESARIRLAYAYDKQFAVSLLGIRTLPHQIEAVYERMSARVDDAPAALRQLQRHRQPGREGRSHQSHRRSREA